ncbi:DUF3096 domain-containing protein [Candidatus Bathyarchaeota archaeon]|nr:DUF3096 domain-containing protein [Candidatus Bathyarchaeota archaeon]
MSEVVEKSLKKIGITISKPVLAILCIIFGIIIIVVPELLGILIGIFLILEGILLLTDYIELQRQKPQPG